MSKVHNHEPYRPVCNERLAGSCMVVLDPENPEDIERFRLAYRRARKGDDTGDWRNWTLAALREFANPTPPKPAEPTGLGAVVEGREGNKWVRTNEYPNLAWRHVGSRDRVSSWPGLDAYLPLTTLSEGVS